MQSHRFAALSIATGLFLLASSASAVPITWVFSASISSSSAVGTGTATTETTLTGSFTFESTTPDAGSGGVEADYDAGMLSLTFQIGGDAVVTTVPAPSAGFRVFDDAFAVSNTIDGVAINGGFGSTNGTPGNSGMRLEMGTTDLSFWSSTAIPSAPPTIGLLGMQGLILANVLDAAGNGYSILGIVTSFTVPEPGVVLLGIVAVGLGFGSRARRGV